jgi:predicted ArsR family transcriptional regulator
MSGTVATVSCAELEILLMGVLGKDAGMTAEDIADELDMNYERVRRQLVLLCEEGRLKRVLEAKQPYQMGRPKYVYHLPAQKRAAA